ncbi:hypothetical protein EV127DRAFT_488855 [Xylaria flabelliformis]|nr:hypothetical protein EV127DRAFT_488855 [Xylaria flabelliformis]
MPKLVTVVGATGNQGGAVITALNSDPNYSLRGLTRNLESRAAQELKNQGIEVVEADLDSLSSLKAAFAGSYAVYGVTGVNELLANHDLPAAEKIEEGWGKNIAQAAAETPGLQHFIWSTLPHASEISNGRYRLTNHVAKNKVDDYIRANAELAAKTTFFVIAQYHSNYSYGPVSIHPIPSADAYVHFASHPPETPIFWIGDVTRNLPPFIKPILEQPDKTKGNVVFAHSEVRTSEESLQIWARTKGVRAFHVPVSAELVKSLWGKYADVLAGMWRYWGEFREKSWSAPGYVVLTKDDLGVTNLITLAESFKDYEI